MKAKIIKTGEIVEVYHEPQHSQTTNIYKEAVFVNGRMWEEDKLDFSINSESKEVDLEKEMEARYLMIGDWVTGKKWIENPFKVTRINDNGKYYYGITSDGSQVGPFFLEEIEPIPIVTEILEKNGFKKDGYYEEMYYWNWGISNSSVSYDKETGMVRIFHALGHLVFVLPLSYVHELQHALRLCGIEKTIEL